MTVMVATPSEPLGPQQRVDKVDHEPYRHEPGQRIVEDHENLLRDGRRRRRSGSRARRSRARRRPKRRPAWECSEGLKRVSARYWPRHDLTRVKEPVDA